MQPWQARADEFASGERVPAQQNLMFEPEFVELRGQARAVAARFVQGKQGGSGVGWGLGWGPVGSRLPVEQVACPCWQLAHLSLPAGRQCQPHPTCLPPRRRPAEEGIARAAEQLHQLRYLLLEAALPPDTAPVRHQLLLRVAEALLDGSTPAAAAPLLVGWLQEGLRRAEGGAQEAGQAQGRLSDQDRVSCLGHVTAGWLLPGLAAAAALPARLHEVPCRR